MDIEIQTRENTKAISDLAATVTRIATVVEITERQRSDERQDMRNVVAELKILGDKIGTISSISEKIGELSGEIGKLRHDIKNLENAQQAIPLLKNSQVISEKVIADHETRVNILEKWKDNTDGAAGAVKVIVHIVWAFASVGGLTFIGWLMGLFNGGRIGGE